MRRPAQRELVHKVNNLLGVIYTQAEVGRSTPGVAVAALAEILRAAEATVPYVRAAQEELQRGGDGSGS